MDDYRFEQRKYKRGDHCIVSFTDKNGVGRSCLCGCGTRIEPNKKHKKRMVRVALKDQLKKMIDDMGMTPTGTET